MAKHNFKIDRHDKPQATPEVTDAVDADTALLSEDLPETPTETPPSDETASEAGFQPSQSLSHALPPAATSPATAPASEPKAATAPASGGEAPKKRKVIDIAGRCKPCPYPIPADKTQFKGYTEEKAEEMVRLVPCQFVADLVGRINLKCSFTFRKGDMYFLPNWFALTYPSSIIIKE